LLAGLSFYTGFQLYKKVIEPQPAVLNYAVKAFFFTAVVGIISLLLFQSIAASATEMKAYRFGGAKTTLIFWIVRIIGYAYAIAEDGQQHSFVTTLLAMLFSVALCEEMVKLTPVVWYASQGKLNRRSDAFFIGAISGLGFGVVESIFYAFTRYGPGVPTSVYLNRFFGAAFGHGVYTLLASAVLFELRQDIVSLAKSKSNDAWWQFIGLIALCSLASAIPHAFFNTLGNYSNLLAVGVDTLCVWIACRIIRSTEEIAAA
jgi:RsiW-degrading membrane proteinase PrsW (M82 family)